MSSFWGKNGGIVFTVIAKYMNGDGELLTFIEEGTTVFVQKRIVAGQGRKFLEGTEQLGKQSIDSDIMEDLAVARRNPIFHVKPPHTLRVSISHTLHNVSVIDRRGRRIEDKEQILG